MATVPPSYSDLGKSARDLFSKGFNYGFYKMEAKTKTSNGVEFTTNGSSNHDSGKVTGSLETKYKCDDYGVTFTEKWHTDNTLNAEINIQDQLVKGLKLSFDTQFAPQTGKKTGQIKTSYKREYLNGNCDVEFGVAGPTVNLAAVSGYQGWLAGYQCAYDTTKCQKTKSNFTVGYTADDFTLNTSVNDGTEFTGSIFQRVNSELDTGLQLKWAAGSNDTNFAVAAKYCPEKDVTYRAKVNNSGQIGMSYQQKIRNGVSLTLSTNVESKNFHQGGHKLGLGLDFEA